MVIGRIDLILHIIRLTRIENFRNALLDQIHDMTMRQLSRVAERIRRNRRHSFIIQFRTGFAGKHDLIPQEGQERKPERIVLIHVQHARDADTPARRMLQRTIIAEYAFIFVPINIRRLFPACLLAANAALAAVAGKIFAAIGKFLHRNQTLISAALAAIRTRRNGKGFEISG